MSERFTFPIADIRRAKKRAAAAARISRGVEPVAGTIDPTPVLESFGCLRVKREWKLLACLMGDHLGKVSSRRQPRRRRSRSVRWPSDGRLPRTEARHR